MLGIPHHTGYPLYTMVGWVWAQLPLGSVARRMNLFSTLFGAVSVGLAAALALRLARGAVGAVVAALAAGVALALAPLDWHWATIAGVRSAAVAEVGWMLVTAVGVLAASSPGRRERGGVRDQGPPAVGTGASGVTAGPASGPRSALPTGRGLVWLGLACGVALAHHRAGALALPAISLALVTVPSIWRVPWRTLLAALGLFVLPLLSYLYLPIRAMANPPFHQWHPETWDGFWDLALALEHSQHHFNFPLSAMPYRAWLLYQHLLGEFGRLGLGLALVGCVWLLWRWPRAWLALAAFFVIQSAQVLNWDTGPDQLNLVYELPAHLVVAVWIGLSVLALGRVRWLPALAGLIVLAWLGYRGVGELAGLRADALSPVNHDRSVLADGYQARRLVEGGLASVEPNAVVVGDWEQATVVWYLQLVERAKPDVQVNYPVTNLGAALHDYPDRPIWLMARTAVPADRRLSMDGPFVRVAPPDHFATAPPSDVVAVSAHFEDALELVGLAYGDRLGGRTLNPDPSGDVLPVTLYWRALGAARKDLSVSARLIAPDGRIAAQQDNTSPVLSLYPTSRWREGEVVGDYYELPYRTLAPGRYALQVRVYLVENGRFRDLHVGASDHADVAAVVR